ncbi:MAG: dihydroorotate dehydrogenase electron transfer subunit [Bacteroidales bacterium]|jgi:dihydroorotate dehydrogenase electron transfer subunit|nr:dihydroorotate dehydrogenase electron transfer subunit [Bacteroidales bacterium]
MKKYISDLRLVSTEELSSDYFLLKFTRNEPLPDMLPGQFVEVKVDNSPTTFLRRPISVNYVDKGTNELWLLIHAIGDGTRVLSALPVGSVVNMVYPLGNSFTMPEKASERLLLVGGGVGTAPMLYLGAQLYSQGFHPTFLLGARSASGILQLDHFERFGEVFCTTEDGSMGEKGFVTQHSVLASKPAFSRIYSCGPKPMMMAIASYARKNNISCEVSLENTMACGVGACLCCVEDTQKGHVCVCTEGPVFNINQLKWPI